MGQRISSKDKSRDLKPNKTSTLRNLRRGFGGSVLGGRCEFAHRHQQAVYFFGGVVMHQPDAKQAACFFYAKAFGKIQSVVVAIPRKDPTIPEKFRAGERR